jgi:Tol biopolymer transport system component
VKAFACQGANERLDYLSRGVGATLAPDGSKVAFVAGRDGATEIYVMNADGLA